MKKFIDRSENIYIVADTMEIKAIFGSIVRAKKTNLVALYSEHPKFNDKQIYAICIDTIANWVYIVNSDTIMSMIVHNELSEYKGLI